MIPYDRKLHGHSDADVVLHALIDAILGALALGDIGDHFPDTDENRRGCDSAELLMQVIEMMKDRGGAVINIDIIIFAERPKLGTQKEMMKKRIAQIVGLPTDRVNIKAKTGEQIGIIGRGEAISAQAVVLIDRTPNP